MTKRQQTKLYFPAWHAAAAAHGWKAGKGQLIGERLECWGGPNMDDIYQRIWTIAEQRAGAACGPMPDDFRHACHVVALGRDKSSYELDNKELDRVVALFRLLAEPDDLAATMTWLNPQEEQRKRMLWWIRNRCVESYVVAVAREKFGTDNWQALSCEGVKELHMTLKHRQNAWKPHGYPHLRPEPETANCPF